MMQSVQILTLALLALGSWAAQDFTEKSGYCPFFQPTLSDLIDCKRTCQNDTICPGDMKCCRKGCSWMCMNPMKEKAGMCPGATSSSEERLPCGVPCETDKDCDGEAKCCVRSCGRTCSMPIKVRPGRCPVVSEWCPRNERVIQCRGDYNCQAMEKCCFYKCGMRCMESIPEEQVEATRFHQEESPVLAL
ncbi:whey acidic protein-like [Gracilinanus agilis]|uniref:whey acidic protein-like n=1 Tax=Gracilinanus agilis TaxID=191870 RepID=UPI001CFE2049|nr:whey acidic protein-like [Gracilinanus agilis]